MYATKSKLLPILAASALLAAAIVISANPASANGPAWKRVEVNVGYGDRRRSNRDPGDDEYYVNHYDATRTGVREEVRTYSDGEVVKHWEFEWWLDREPPAWLEAGETLEMTLYGAAIQHRGRSNDALTRTAHLRSEQLGFDEHVKLKRYRKEDREHVTIRVRDSDPQRFVIELGKPGTAAHVEYVYESVGGATAASYDGGPHHGLAPDSRLREICPDRVTLKSGRSVPLQHVDTDEQDTDASRHHWYEFRCEYGPPRGGTVTGIELRYVRDPEKNWSYCGKSDNPRKGRFYGRYRDVALSLDPSLRNATDLGRGLVREAEELEVALSCDRK